MLKVPTKQTMSRRKANLILVFITLIWGSTFVIVDGAIDTSGPFTFVAWRMVAAFMAIALLFPRRLRALTRAELRAGALIGLWLALGHALQTAGMHQGTPPGKAGFITGLSVVIVPVLATFLLRRPPHRGAVAGVIVALLGLGLLSLSATLSILPGDLWVMGCALCFALHIVTVAHFAPHHDTIRLTAVQIATAALLTTATAFMFETPSLALPLDVWAAIAFTGVIATALVFGLQVGAQRFTTPTQTALIFSLEPVFAAFFGWWWAGEVFGPKELVGCALILAGMLLAEVGAGARAAAQETLAA